MWVPLLNDAFGKRTLNRVFRIPLSIQRVENMWYFRILKIVFN